MSDVRVSLDQLDYEDEEAREYAEDVADAFRINSTAYVEIRNGQLDFEVQALDCRLMISASFSSMIAIWIDDLKCDQGGEDALNRRISDAQNIIVQLESACADIRQAIALERQYQAGMPRHAAQQPRPADGG